MPQRRVALHELLMLLRGIWTLKSRRTGVDVDEMPGRERALRVQTRLDIDHRGGTKVSPREFFGAHPSESDGLSRPLREARRFDRGLASMFSPESPTKIRNDHAHAILGNVKRASQLSPHPKR